MVALFLVARRAEQRQVVVGVRAALGAWVDVVNFQYARVKAIVCAATLTEWAYVS